MKTKLFLLGCLALAPVFVNAADFSVSVPEGAHLIIGTKSKHFVDFSQIDPVGAVTLNGITTFTYDLPTGKVYNYRTWTDGGLTNAGYFTMNADASKCPVLAFTSDDYTAHSPNEICHDVKGNDGYETGDIFLNINPRGHLRLKSGETFDLHAMRTWELTDNSVNNYFIEPDFHFSVLNLDGQPSDDVVAIDETAGSAWASLKAVGPGSAIVLVTYDGICLNFYSGEQKKDYLGGSYWGGIWPENTGVFVVTVDDAESSADPNMTVNSVYNADAKKLSGEFVDAEHDVFYYLKEQKGFTYTFTPSNVSKVEIAYPSLSGNAMSFNGFASEGVTVNNDGSYSILLKQGRQIVRLSDASGRCVYQVMTAKECQREISNESRLGSTVFQPGDKLKISYKGLRHPANKIAGIYNMSAYVTYNGIPSGTSLIQSANQYTFGSSEAAQTMTVTIPDNIDTDVSSTFVMKDGVIQVTGFGDPIGNHRNTLKNDGRSPNLNAVAHQTYFGALPEVSVPLSPMTMFNISLRPNVDGLNVRLVHNGTKEIEPNSDGTYSWTYGNYTLTAGKDGFRCFRTSFELKEGDNLTQNIEINMVKGKEGMWNGFSVEAVDADEEGTCHISNGAQLAWLAQTVNEQGKSFTSKVVLDNDIDLGDYSWTPIAKEKTKNFAGRFDGNGFTVRGLYIDDATLSYAGLFGFVQGLSTSIASIENLVVEGTVMSNKYVGGIAGDVDKYAGVDRCANYASVKGESYVGGVVGYLSASAKCTLTNSYNVGDISGGSNVGGVVGYNNASAEMQNIFSVGQVSETATSGACVGGTTKKNKLVNAFSLYEYEITTGQEKVSEQRMASGEIAYKLGDAFSQKIGYEPFPVFDSWEVFYDDSTDTYYNVAPKISELKIDTKEITLDVYDNPSCEISASYGPEDVEEPKLDWSSSNESVVTVEHDGSVNATLKAVNTGNATIRVEHVDNPDLYDTCDVVVTSQAEFTEIVLGDNNSPVDVYDISGKVIKMHASKDGLRALAPGLYLIRIGREEKKVLVK